MKISCIILVLFSSVIHAATVSWDNREGNWFRWNLEQIPENTSAVLLFAISEQFDSPIWLNRGTYDWQLMSNGGAIGQWNGGTKTELSNWWFDGNVKLYIECLTSDAEVWKWQNGYNDYPNAWYYQPYNYKTDLNDYVVARSNYFSTNWLVENGYIGLNNSGNEYFDFSNYMYAIPEPSNNILLLFGLSLLMIKRKKVRIKNLDWRMKYEQ